MDRGAALACIVGSPRSGTTVLAGCLDAHPAIAQLYEPYFLWEWHLGTGEDDRRTAADGSPAVRGFLQREFGRYLARSGGQILLEKTPINSFRIPFIRAIFPETRWIHLVRDGRDATASIHREWQRRRGVVEGRDPRRLLALAWSMVRRQPFWRNRFQALAYELRQRRKAGPAGLMNKAKWRGMAGWGPRFPGWYEALQQVDDAVEFNALQWRRCVEAVQRDLAAVPDELKLEVRYEALVSNPEATLDAIQRFLGVDPLPGLGERLEPRSVGRWRTALSAQQQDRVSRLLDDKLDELGYAVSAGPSAERA